MRYFKIYNRRRQAWWRQDAQGYTDAAEAGYFAEDSVAVANARDRFEEDTLVPFEPSALQLKLAELAQQARSHD